MFTGKHAIYALNGQSILCCGTKGVKKTFFLSNQGGDQLINVEFLGVACVKLDIIIIFLMMVPNCTMS